jgi:hypothetical protein
VISLNLSYHLVAAVGLILLGLPARTPAGEPAPAPRPIYPRFDLTYMPEIAEQGLLGFRPGEIARHAKGRELDMVTQMFMFLMSQSIHNANFDVDFDAAEPPDIGNIEQCVFSLQLQVTTPTPDKKGSFFFGGKTPCMIRTVQPFDWNTLARKWFPNAAPRRLAGRNYLRIRVNLPQPHGHTAESSKDEPDFETVFAVFIPDDRTLVCATEEDIFELLDRLAEGKPAPTPPPGWNELDREFAAFVLDMREEKPLSGKFTSDYAWGKDLTKLIDSCQTVAVGISLGERTTLKFIGTTRDEFGAANATKSLRRLLKAARAGLAYEEESVLKSFALEMLKNTAIASEGAQFTASTSADRNVLKMIAALLHGED